MKFKNALKKFAYETLRPHSKEEYAELFLRGSGGDGKPTYPWFYARVLLFSLLLFSILCIGYGLSKLNFLMVAATGGFFADIVFIVLLVELYPKRDLPLLTPILVLFAGGVLSCAFSYILYGIYNVAAPFADQAWTAFVEETSKALATIIILLILKKRNPFVCFIVGAAVGGGYSAFENMWYMYTHGFGWMGLSQAIETGLWRSLGTPFSHAAWAGLFGWALSFEKPWRRWQPYAIYAFNYTMHFFVNFPLMPQFAEWKGYPISAVTGVLTIALMIFILVRCRRSLISPYGQAEQLVLPQLEEVYSYPKINGAYLNGQQAEYATDIQNSKYTFIANAFAAAAIFCLSFALLGPTLVFGGYSNYKTYNYNNWQDALYVIQSGRMDIAPDYGREYVEYDNLNKNFSYTWTDGELLSATQRERYGNYYFHFTYGYNVYMDTFEDENGNFFVNINGQAIAIGSEDGNLPTSVRIWELKSVSMEFNNAFYTCRTLTVKSAGGTPVTYRYYLLNSEVMYINVLEDGGFSLDMHDRVPIKLTECIVFSSVFGAAAIGSGIAYALYKIKSKRR